MRSLVVEGGRDKGREQVPGRDFMGRGTGFKGQEVQKAGASPYRLRQLHGKVKPENVSAHRC